MRTETIGNITLTLPPDLTGAFSRNPITVAGYTGTHVLMTVTKGEESVTEKRAMFGTECFFDLSYYLQVLFDTDAFNVDYSAISDSGLMDEFTVQLDFYNGDTLDNTFTFNIVAVWSYNVSLYVEEELTMFEGYPFTIGAIIQAENDSILVDNVSTIIEKIGVYNVPVTEPVNIYVEHVVGSMHTIKQTTKIKKECGDGIYLRWIDRSGIFRYWLFKQGDITTTVKDGDVFIRKNMGTDFGKRRFGKEVGNSVEVCAPLVDGDTFAFLLECVSSPIVDMYSDGDWLPVNIKGETIVRERTTLQDFIINVELIDTIVQKL